jgi:hypothetical protein
VNGLKLFSAQLIRFLVLLCYVMSNWTGFWIVRSILMRALCSAPIKKYLGSSVNKYQDGVSKTQSSGSNRQQEQETFEGSWGRCCDGVAQPTRQKNRSNEKYYSP